MRSTADGAWFFVDKRGNQRFIVPLKHAASFIKHSTQHYATHPPQNYIIFLNQNIIGEICLAKSEK